MELWIGVGAMHESSALLLIMVLVSCSAPAATPTINDQPGAITPYRSVFPASSTPSPTKMIVRILTPIIATPTVAIFNIQTDTMLAYVKDYKIHVADYSGRSIPVFDIFREDHVVLSRMNMKISPDWRYIAYLNLRPDLDPTINVVDIVRGRKIFQDYFPRAVLSDFAWSPDSKNIAIAYNYENSADNYAGFISLLDPFSGGGRNTLYEPENMIVTQIEWPTQKRILYSYYSFGKNTYHMASLASCDLSEKQCIRRNISPLNKPAFWFAISPEKDRVYFYSNPGFESANGPAIRSIFHIHSLQMATCPPVICQYAKLINVNWIGRYMVGFQYITTHPVDQNAWLYDINGNQSLSICWGEPGSWSYTLRVVQRNDRTIAVVFTSGMGTKPNRMWAWDIGEFLKTTEAEEWQDITPECPKAIWEISDAWPDSASIQY